jgi:diphthamide synthase subunit DPH2
MFKQKDNTTLKFSSNTVKGFLQIAEMLKSNDVKEYKNRKFYSIKINDVDKYLTARSVEILLDLKKEHI